MKRYIAILAFVAALCSCSKTEPEVKPDPVNPDPASREIVIGVGSDETKSSLSGSSVLWAEDDLIQVFSDTNRDGVEFKLKDGAGTGNARFTNRIYEEAEPEEISGSEFYLCYPYGEYTFDGSRFTTRLSSSVSYVEGSFGVGANLSFGRGDKLAGGSFTMQNLCGLVKIALKGSMKVSEVDLTLDKNIAGEASFAIPAAGSAPVLEMSSSASKTIAMHCDGVQLNRTTATDFIFVVPAGNYSHIELTVCDESGTSAVLSKNLALTVARSGSTGINSTLPDNGIAGSIEMMTEIWFEDANEEKGREEITAVSINVRAQRNEDDVTNAQKWTNRRAGIYAFISQHQYDIIGTQECEYRQKKNIIDNVSGYSVYGRGSEYGKDDDETKTILGLIVIEDHSQDSGNYIFYRSDKYDLVASGTYWLSDTPSKISKYSSSKHYRTCCWVKLKSKATNQQFYVFNTHLDNSDDGVRGQQLDVLWAQMQVVNSEHLPMILTGDLNMTTTGSPLETFRKSGKMFFARNEKNVCFDDAHKSFNGYGSGRANFDHIAYKDFYKIKSFETDIDPYADVTYISDHYPIIATLMFN